MSISFKTSVAAIAIYAAGSLAAIAAPCQTTDISVSVINGTATSSIYASACSNEYAGNDTGAGGTLISRLNAGLFASYSNDWSLYGKSDDAGSGVVANNGATSGTWTVDFTPDTYSVFAIAMKVSTGYTTYLFDLNPLTATTAGGLWQNLALTNKQGKPQDLSHLTVAVRDTQPAPIPLPAAGWMLLAGLAGLGLAKRRKV